MSRDVFELVNEARDIMKDNQAFMDELRARQTLIDGYTQQLEDAQKAGIKSAEQYYQGKINELRMKEGEKDFDRYITRGEMGEASEAVSEGLEERTVEGIKLGTSRTELEAKLKDRKHKYEEDSKKYQEYVKYNMRSPDGWGNYTQTAINDRKNGMESALRDIKRIESQLRNME